MAKRVVSSRGSKRRRSSEREAYWRKMIDRWSGSGLSQTAFCRRHSLSVWSLRWWRCELKRRDSASAGSSTVRRRRRKRQSTVPAFVPVEVASGVAQEASVLRSSTAKDEEASRGPFGAGVIEVVLAYGRCVRIGSDFDASVLAKVVCVLEGGTC